MPIYRPASDELVRQVRQVAERYHRRLVDVELRVDVLEARPKCDDAGDPIEEALRHHGYPCLATIKINGPKERGAGRGDCLLTVDAYTWPELDERTQIAVLDHELCHLELAVNDKGQVKRDDYDRPKLRIRRQPATSMRLCWVKRDDYDRPKLRIRLHDQQHGWFDDVAVRHGDSSIEVQQARRIDDQIYMPGEPAGRSR